MSNVQKAVNLYQCVAVAGDRASQNPVIYTPFNCIASGAVKVGSFVWLSTTAGDPSNAVANKGTGTPLGFVERRMVNPLYPMDEATGVIPDGFVLAVAKQGDFFIVADATATAGAVVYANLTTGAVTLTAVEGSTVDTGFKVSTAGASGDTIVISNWAN